jgi:two-component system NtrC family sensor kinase
MSAKSCGHVHHSVARRSLASAGARSSADGGFAGVVQASVLPDYFQGFYAKIADEAGDYAALIREDGAVLARLPAIDHNIVVGSNSDLMRAIETKPAEGVFTNRSTFDGIERKIAYRKLPRFPVYVLSGLETRAIRAKWLAQMGQSTKSLRSSPLRGGQEPRGR